MNQSKIESGIETFVNVFSGWFISMLLWSFLVAPMWGYEDRGIAVNMGVTLTFTVVSIIRGYFWRRFFNNRLHLKVKKMVGKLC